MGFADNFLWGAASAAYQIEGAYNEDGKGPGIWDSLSAGHVLHGDNGNVACDHYHRFREDIALMKKLGLKAYRFSVSWPRIMPCRGQINQKGIEFYKELAAEIRSCGMEPLCTLYHWDLPMWAHESGGWYADSISDDFASYTRIVVDALSDQVAWWMTFNEPTSFIGAGYIHGDHAPFERIDLGTDEGKARAAALTRNVLLAHGKAEAAIREHAILPPKVGIATDSHLFIPDSESESDICRARGLTFADDVEVRYLNWWLDPILKGTANQVLSMSLKDGDMEVIHKPLDFLGWNCYHANNYLDGPDGRMLTPYQGVPRTNMGWPITPDALYWGVRFIHERYDLPVMITENGMANVDFVMDDGCVHDPQRIQYMKWYLRGLLRAADEGYPVLGYMAWSIMDNFEWALGYEKRFGLIYVDYLTQKRIPKDSAVWYSDVIRTNGGSLL